ncbi:MAG: adenine phosphoribosyltransferase [Minwuia sp.]|uniref:adenine phosphoribosyltransferase n=1 Tax=Minwuia sp. TaxID=2493630 RepID=UPI003A899D31
MDEIRDKIRTIPDYPKPGIMFRDVTTLWGDARGFRTAIDRLVQPYAGVRIDKVAGIEARGFVLGGAVAHQLSTGFLPIRKKGKLPGSTLTEDYQLEYGTDTIEIHDDAIKDGDNVLIVDDLLATGGTAAAAANLIRKAGGTVIGCCFIVDLPDLGGKEKLLGMGLSVIALCEFEGD